MRSFVQLQTYTSQVLATQRETQRSKQMLPVLQPIRKGSPYCRPPRAATWAACVVVAYRTWIQRVGIEKLLADLRPESLGSKSPTAQEDIWLRKEVLITSSANIEPLRAEQTFGQPLS
jgi:hypothetical protein